MNNFFLSLTSIGSVYFIEKLMKNGHIIPCNPQSFQGVVVSLVYLSCPHYLYTKVKEEKKGVFESGQHTSVRCLVSSMPTKVLITAPWFGLIRLSF